MAKSTTALTIVPPPVPDVLRPQPPAHALFPGGAATREERFVEQALALQRAQITAMQFKTEQGEAAIGAIWAEAYAVGAQLTADIVAIKQAQPDQEVQRYLEGWTPQILAQGYQHLGAAAHVGSLRVAELVHRLIEPPPPRRWRS